MTQPILPDFDTARAELVDLRREIERCRGELLLAHEATRRAERALAEFLRVHRRASPRESASHRADLEGARGREARLREELAGLRATEAGRLKWIEALTDPRDRLGTFAPHTPILLFPLRLETRFMSGPRGSRQLCVRVYPDTCLIDTFEASLAEQEVTNAQAFWARIWRAAGDDALERAAWRELVAAHGSGRASWIIRHYLPLNPAQAPLATDPIDVHLIITAPGSLPADITGFWEATWRAQGSAAAQAAAYAALEAAIGVGAALTALRTTRPFNLEDPPPSPTTRQDARVRVTVVQVQPVTELEARRSAWSSPARIDLLPERFVLVAYQGNVPVVQEIGSIIRTPLFASPDPNAPPAEALKQVDDTMQIPPDLAWMFDLQAAIDVGMAMRVDLTAEQARDGFDRIVVLGVRLADTADEGRDHLAALLEHHLHSRAGLSILPQGTPTNNTESEGAGYSFRDDSDATFDVFVREKEQYAPEPDPLLRRDGQWLADLLALPHELVQRIPNAGRLDQADARAMQIALWPGTLGHMMGTQLAPVFTEAEVDWTRDFFTRWVSGRGPIPALRVGSQPYGILPTTAFSRVAWAELDSSPRLHRLHEVLKRVDADWKPLVDRVSYIGKAGGDPHQILLDVLALHPTSAEYYPLQAESVDHKYFELSFFGVVIANALLALFPAGPPLDLLRAHGYDGVEVPDLFNRIFKARQTPLTGPLIDDRPLSEAARIRPYAGPRNYIEWLVDAARGGIQVLQEEAGFDGGTKPGALLYLLLRHALQLAFRDAGIRLGVAAGVVTEAAVLRKEPAFVHIADAQASESSYDLLFRPEARVTGASGMRVGDYIAQNIPRVSPQLHEQVDALQRLASLPTARLERLLAEHVDCCTYRADAWKQGLLTQHLAAVRQPPPKDGRVHVPVTARGAGAPLPAAATGIHLGAFGWLEPLRPRAGTLAPVDLPADVGALVNQRDAVPLMRDDANGGLIHAPSINHATTAAVLRNGYLANDGRLAVNITSRRVRLALEILEGMRNGQSLGALLGYHLERHVHDNGPLGVRDLIYEMRRAFPLAANQIAGTDTETGTAQESIAAMNVVDGRKLVEHVQSTDPPQATYPFGAALPARSADQQQAMTDAVAHIRDINDAVADLILAESVHQAVLGNYERAAGTLDAFAKGSHPLEPDVVRTPRTGVTLTHRIAIHLPAAPDADPLPGTALTPLAAAEPAINVWLRDRLPAPANVGCNVTFTARATGAETTVFVSQAALALHPIDLLYRVQAGGEQALGDIDELILRHVQTAHAPRHDRPIMIHHTARVVGRFSWFALQALLRSLRVLLGSRPLQPSDLVRATDATIDQHQLVSLDAARVTTPNEALRTTLLPLLGTLTAAVSDPAVTVDDALGQFATTLSRFAAYRLPQTGTGFVYEWRANAYSALAARVRERVMDWDRRLARYDAQVLAYDALPLSTPDAERLKRLASAELAISTAMTLPAPANLADYRDIVLPARRGAFVAKRDALDEIVTVARPTFSELLEDAKLLVPLAAFDVNELAFGDEETAVARFREQLVTIIASLKTDVEKRIAQVDTKVAALGAAGPGDQRTRLLQESGRMLFGDDFQFVPHITLPAAAIADLASAVEHSGSGELTRHITDTRRREFPAEDWLHGIARVRDKMHHWENVMLLAEVAGTAKPFDLVPLQLPFGPGEPWLAMELPDGYEITADRLLYTTHLAEPFDATEPVCGLLVDEWTEVIPGIQETTGIAFHYDRPNSEPPQSWLLAMPYSRDGVWSWGQLLAAVNETLDSARLRAIEPVHLDTTAYSWFLPATMSAYTMPEISISNNLLKNRFIYSDVVSALPGDG